MPKAGRFDYPDLDIEDAVERLTKMWENTKKTTNTREIAIQAMGMSDGGRAQQVLASFDKYGIAATGGHEVSITSLGEKILFAANEDERRQYMKEGVMNVGLFSELVETYGSNPTDQQIRVFLQQTASVDLPKIAGITEDLSRKLKRNQAFLTPAKVGERETSQASSVSRGASSYIGGGERLSGVIEIRPIEGKAFVFPLDNVKLARSLVNAVFDDLEKKTTHQAEKREEK